MYFRAGSTDNKDFSKNYLPSYFVEQSFSGTICNTIYNSYQSENQWNYISLILSFFPLFMTRISFLLGIDSLSTLIGPVVLGRILSLIPSVQVSKLFDKNAKSYNFFVFLHRRKFTIIDF